MIDLNKRLQKLADQLQIKRVTLTMPDGSTRKIRSGKHVLHLFCAAMDRASALIEGKPVPKSECDAEIDLIVASVSDDSEEQGAGSMIPSIRHMLSRPAKAASPNIGIEKGTTIQ